MWLHDAVPLAVQRNASVPLGLQLVDEISGEPVDITGCAVRLAVRYAAGSGSILASFAGVLDVPLEGAFGVTLDGRAFSGVPGVQEVVVLAYDVKVTDTDGTALIVMRGPLALEPGVND